MISAHHSVIYTSLSEPILDEGGKAAPEGGNLMTPGIRVKPRDRADQMDPTSLVNFAHLYLISYQVKVIEVGDVHGKSVRRLVEHFLNVWKSDYASPDSSVTKVEQHEKSITLLRTSDSSSIANPSTDAKLGIRKYYTGRRITKDTTVVNKEFKPLATRMPVGPMDILDPSMLYLD